MQATKPKYPIGTIYKRIVAKNVFRVCTVVDIETTFNDAGEQVRQRYVSSHEFMGQSLIERDIVQLTIDRATIITGE
jgi:hypothetical protein